MIFVCLCCFLQKQRTELKDAKNLLSFKEFSCHVTITLYDLRRLVHV